MTEQTKIEIEGKEKQTEESKEIQIEDISEEKYTKPNLDGKTVNIFNVTLFQGYQTNTTRSGKKHKPVSIKVWYDEKTYELYGGMKAYLNDDGSTSQPQLWKEGKSHSAKLFKVWCDHEGKNPKETTLKEFLLDLKGKKAVLTNITTEYDDKEFRKNIITEFIKE